MVATVIVRRWWSERSCWWCGDLIGGRGRGGRCGLLNGYGAVRGGRMIVCWSISQSVGIHVPFMWVPEVP
jgi:hypothetical protein